MRAATQTGGRDATTRRISGDFALCVGEPVLPAPPGWRWFKLTDVARLESGHTPSRKHPEYWGGDIPWITLSDARAHDGGVIFDTIEQTNELGIANSSARMLPAGTVCLSRTASVGYVVVTGKPMATSQDFVNWVCSEKLDPYFLRYLLITERSSLGRFSSGAVHQTIYFPEVKAFHICLPPVHQQKRIVAILDEAFEGIGIATANAEKNLVNARELFDAELGALMQRQAREWSLLPLEELTERITKGSSPKWQGIQYVERHGILFVTSENVGANRMLLDRPKFVENRFNEKDKKSILQRGDVLTNIVGASIGRTAVFDSDAIANINQAVCLLRCKQERLLPHYLSAVLNSQYFRAQLFENTTDAARANLSLSYFRSFLVPVPPLDVQAAIFEQAGSLEASRDLLDGHYERRSVMLNGLRKTILARAFSGQLTLARERAA